MSTGFSIHIGLNRVDPKHYQDENGRPWRGELFGCEHDARDLQRLARSRGFKSQLMLNEKAISAGVISAIAAAADTLKAGDTFVLTYSGHGGQLPDTNGDEPDQLDETWCLYDRQLVDDELHALWAKFAKGVRILMLSDSCHSGTVLKDPFFPALAAAHPGTDVRLLPPDVRDATARVHAAQYAAIQRAAKAGDRIRLKATVALISGCQDNQLSADGVRNGLFTQTLLQVWNKAKFKGDLRRFHKAIVRQMPMWQSPNYIVIGARNLEFEKQRPFTI